MGFACACMAALAHHKAPGLFEENPLIIHRHTKALPRFLPQIL